MQALRIAYVVFCQQYVRAMCLQTQAGERRGIVAMCLQNGFTGTRLRGQAGQERRRSR